MPVCFRDITNMNLGDKRFNDLIRLVREHQKQMILQWSDAEVAVLEDGREVVAVGDATTIMDSFNEYIRYRWNSAIYPNPITFNWLSYHEYLVHGYLDKVLEEVDGHLNQWRVDEVTNGSLVFKSYEEFYNKLEALNSYLIDLDSRRGITSPGEE